MEATLYATDHTDMIMGMLSGILTTIALVTLVFCVISVIANWKIFKKAGEPGVAAIVPFWNTAVLFRMTWGKWYLMFLMLIPLVNIVIGIITMFKLAKVFGKGMGFGFGLLFLSPVFMLILAFGKAQYVGINKDVSTGPAVPEEPEQDTQDEPLQDALPETFDDSEKVQESLPIETEAPVRRAGRSWSV